MPDRLSLHAPTLVNTLGHASGAIIFGILLYLLFVDWRRNPTDKRILPSVAAGLAMLWNLGSMVGLATDPQSGFIADLIIATSFSVLSFLPAVLLHISSGDSKRLIMAGYVLSASAAVLHFTDLITGAARYHYAAILLITIGFGVLAITVAVLRVEEGSKTNSSRRLLGSMVLFLFAISFEHFNSNHAGRAWSGEIALHHSGIPLALFVLLNDYRFLLLDTFIRFLVNAFLAATAITIVVLFGTRFDPIREINLRPFQAGLTFVAACVLLILFGFVRRAVQELVTRGLFLRTNPERVFLRIQELAARPVDEEALLMALGKLIAQYIGCDRCEWRAESLKSARWIELSLPIAFAHGDSRWLCLGARKGGRVFLSEDLRTLQELLQEVAKQIDHRRVAEMESLLVRGELQALQAQINPHFLFNTLNTIYGSIQRSNEQARSLILNLSDILRHTLSTDRVLIPLENELQIVRAYLEVERARLGPRLLTEIRVDEEISGIEVPAFSIQPLVENAVRYGPASRPGAGFVRLAISLQENGCVRVSVSNSGAFGSSPESKGNGLALTNVRRRLEICYGDAAHFRIGGDTENTLVGFDVPPRSSIKN